MMTDNELDNLFKNTLGNHEAPIPADMWQRIQPGGDKKRPPVALWWKWYAAAAVFLIAGMAAWWYAGTAPANNSTTASYNTRNKQEKAQPATQNDEGVKNDTNAAPQQNNAAATGEVNPDQPFTADNQPIALPRSANPTKSNHRNDNSNSTAIDNQQNTPANNNIATNNSGNHNNANTLNDNNASQAQAGITPSPAATENKPEATEKQTATKSDIAKNTTDAPAATIKKDNKKARLPWTIELLATSAYADKETYGVKNDVTIGAAPIPPPQPKPSLWNYNTGVRVGIPLTKNLTLKTGVQYAQTRQKADYQQQNLVDMVAINSVGDTSFYRQIVYKTESNQSSYNAVSVPVLISYHGGKKIQVGATAGIIVNAYSWYTGKVPDANYTATLNAKETYRKNTGAALYVGITVAKKVGAVSIFAEPHLQYSLSSFTRSTVSFKQKINTYGVSVGVRTALHK
jgi:hypothetical protein